VSLGFGMCLTNNVTCVEVELLLHAVVKSDFYQLCVWGGGKESQMGLSGFKIFGTVKGLGIGVCVFAAISLSACASNPTKVAATDANPNTKCKPTFTHVYQPPLKLGGFGRVIMVPNGEKCGVVG